MLAMKEKSREKCSKYTCGGCGRDFYGGPFVTIEMLSCKSCLCSSSCYNAFIINILKAGAEYNINNFIDTVLKDFEEIISERADYDLILESLSKKIALTRAWQKKNEKNKR